MAFTGKATYDGGAALPEIARDISALIGLVSPFETPLLAALGDPERPALNIKHEWLEDALQPHADAVDNGAGYASGATSIAVDNGARFRIGDLVKPAGADEIMLVTNVVTDTLTVVRQYGGTPGGTLADDQVLAIIGHSALEGEDAPTSRETVRTVRSNYTQIFTEAVKVSGTLDAVSVVGMEAEFDYQALNRLRELLRALERTVINGVAPAATLEGSSAVRRTMNGLIPAITAGITDAASAALDEAALNAALRTVWELGGSPDLIVCGGFQKRAISSFMTGTRGYVASDEALKEVVSVYESDFGRQRVVLSRWVPAGEILLLDSRRIQVMPLRGRHFHLKPLSETGDYRHGQLIGEYTLEVRNAADGGHGRIKNLATS